MTSEESLSYADDEIKTYVDDGDEINVENLSDDKKELVGDSDDETKLPNTNDTLLYSSPMIKSYTPYLNYPQLAQPSFFPFYSPEMCIGTAFPRYPPLPGSLAAAPVPASVTPFGFSRHDNYKVLSSHNPLQALDRYIYHNSTPSQQNVSPEKPPVKKPLNSYMLFLGEIRASVIEETKEKESSVINKIAGKKWRELSEVEKQKYRDMAKEVKDMHKRKYPEWSGKDNYAKKKRKR